MCSHLIVQVVTINPGCWDGGRSGSLNVAGESFLSALSLVPSCASSMGSLGEFLRKEVP